jgi:uncharacterized protein (DUF427 family)
MQARQAVEDVEIIAEAPAAPSVRIEASPRWVRAFIGAEPLADSKRVLLVFEPRRLPVYYFPRQDVRMDRLEPTDYSAAVGDQAPLERWTYEHGGRRIENVGWSYRQADPAHAQLADYIAFYWGKLDAWFEEDQEVFVHPRDPYHRVDVAESSRHVRIVVEGETIADTRRPRLLFETSLPTRYYIPRLDVRLDLLEPTTTSTQCPYKGRAVYWSVRAGGQLHKDLVWSYPFPIPECPRIENLLAFYNEKVDIFIDGELQPRPRTQWS